MSTSISSLMNSYTGTYGSTITPKIDKNGDNQWNIDELSNYAKSYNKATGSELDAAALLSKYDADENGVLGASEQQKLVGDDGLGISALYGESTDDSAANAVGTDWIQKMGATQSAALYRNVQFSEMASTLFSSLGGGSGGSSALSSSFASIVSSQNAAKLYSIQNSFSLSDTIGNFTASM